MPQVTSKAPMFKAQAVINGEIKDFDFEQYSKGSWTVLFFYPLDFTFVCPTEIIAYSDAVSKFSEIGAKVAAVSVDSAYTHLAWVNTGRKEGGLGPINFPLVADLSKDIARQYGVLLDAGLALRGLFVIDPSGVIRHATINDLPVGRNVEETLRIIKAFQFVEKHGEVCPANWQEGADTIKPDPKAAKEYFRKAASA